MAAVTASSPMPLFIPGGDARGAVAWGRAAAVAAVVAVATSLFSHAGGPPRYVEVERILAALFSSVLRERADEQAAPAS